MKTVITFSSSIATIGRCRLAPILIAIVVMAFQKIQAVNPPPDGGYAGGNTAEGQSALLNLTSGTFNTALGLFSLRNNAEGQFNTAVGAGSLLSNTADNNTGTGAGALLSNTIGSKNTAAGSFTLLSNTTGTENTAAGSFALSNNTTGTENAGFGTNALINSTTGGGNTAVGFNALPNNSTGITNTALGFNAGFGVTTADNVIVIGTNVAGQNVDHSCFIGEIFGETATTSAAVFINADGRLGTITSSRRFKELIEPMGKASETLFALRPVRFRYKMNIDPTRTPQLGLVAEDVEKVDPALVVRDKDGKAYSVRYDQINVMLLNEFLKEHLEVEQQRAIIAELQSSVAKLGKNLEVTTDRQQKEIDLLTVGLQKVRAQVGASGLKVMAAE